MKYILYFTIIDAETEYDGVTLVPRIPKDTPKIAADIIIQIFVDDKICR